MANNDRVFLVDEPRCPQINTSRRLHVVRATGFDAGRSGLAFFFFFFYDGQIPTHAAFLLLLFSGCFLGGGGGGQE